MNQFRQFLLFILLLCTTIPLSAQNTIQIAINSSQSSCNATYIDVTSLSETSAPVYVHVDWGDGSDTIIPTDNGINWFDNGVYYCQFQDWTLHQYAYSGTYTISAALYSTATQLPESAVASLTAELCGLNNAGVCPLLLVCNQNNFSMANIAGLVDFIDVNNYVTTVDIMTVSFMADSVPVNNYPQTARLNPDWQNATGFRQFSSNILFPGYQDVDPASYPLWNTGYPAFLIYHEDSVSLDRRVSQFASIQSSTTSWEHAFHVSLNNSVLAKPDSIVRVRIETDSAIVFNGADLLNPVITAHSIEFDVLSLNQYMPLYVPYEMPQTGDYYYMSGATAYIVNSNDTDPDNDTLHTYYDYVNPCFGMMDSVPELHTTSAIGYANQAFELTQGVIKNVCWELDSIQLLVISPSDFELDPLSLAGQDVTYNGDTLRYNALTIPAYQSSLQLLQRYHYAGNWPDTSYVFTLITVHGSDTTTEYQYLNFSDTLTADLGIAIYSAAAVAPTQQGFITGIVSPAGYYEGVLLASVSMTLPSWFTPNTSDLIDPQLQDSTLTFSVVVPVSGGWFTVPFLLPGTTPAGTPYTITAEVVHPGDPVAANDTCSYSMVVLNSYDPNEKHTQESSMLDPLVQDSLTYVVHFQNDGNYPALNVTVRDTLSASLDLSTFQFLHSKHPCTYTLDPVSREAVFYFENIELQPSEENLEASQGLFVYRIAENAGIALGEAILNTAYIYFDFNPAIITNTTLSVNETLGLEEGTLEKVSLFPNPASNVVRFAGAEIVSLQVADLAGKVVVAETAVTDNTLSLNSMGNGLYIVTVTTAAGTQALRLAVEK